MVDQDLTPEEMVKELDNELRKLKYEIMAEISRELHIPLRYLLDGEEIDEFH